MQLRVLIVLPVLLLLGAVLGTAPQAGATDSAPRLLIDMPVHDFGTVEQGTRVEHAFKVRNGGSASLQISKVEGSCGCTAGVSADGIVPPGHETWVTVSLETSRIAGHTAKTVVIHSNDPTVPEAALSLTGTVVTDVVVNPDTLYLGRIRRGATVRREIIVKSGRPGTPYHVVDIQSEIPSVRAHVEPGTAPDEERVIIEVAPDLPLGRFTDELRVRTNSPRQPVLMIPVFGSVEGDLAALPPQVTFELAADGSAAPHDVQITNRSPEPVALTSVTVPAPLAYDLRTVRDGLEWLLTLRLAGRFPVGFREAAVEILTDRPSIDPLIVPVFALDRSRG
jgi:Protein of unknown function (DUF1573)